MGKKKTQKPPDTHRLYSHTALYTTSRDKWKHYQIFQEAERFSWSHSLNEGLGKQKLNSADGEGICLHFIRHVVFTKEAQRYRVL